MCEQRGVTASKSTGTEDSGSEFLPDFLTKLWNKNTPSLSSPLPIDVLGTVYESFLQRTITLTKSGPLFESTRVLRKSGGVYYTPRYVVDYIVEETVGRLIAGKSPREMLGVRVLDPACGTGRFLLRVYERIVEEHWRWLEKNSSETEGDNPFPSDWNREILRNCIFGVDIDEVAVEVTKLSLYLKLMKDEPTDETSGAKASDLRRSQRALLKPCLFKTTNEIVSSYEIASIVGTNIQSGDSLLLGRAGGFDVVLGNPPYGAEMSAEMRAQLASRFEAGTTESAALMMVHASRSLTSPGGTNGFIVPKAFTYSSNWRNVRDELLGEMTSLVDVRKVWPEVRLEQVIYFLEKGVPSERYTNRKRDGERFEDVAVIDKELCRRFGFLLNGISREELEVGLKIQNAGSFLSEYVRNTRGAMFQEQVGERQKGRRVIGGKQIQRFGICGEKGFVASKISLEKNAFVAPESVLVQNIVAHIENPVDHIKITAAVAGDELARKVVILDTVNQLTNRSKLSSYFFLAILNSRLMNWYVYRFIYARAIRTMHFDGPVTSRIPVPRITRANQHLYEEVVRAAKSVSGKESVEISQVIESALHGLYGLSASDVAVIEIGMPRET